MQLPKRKPGKYASIEQDRHLTASAIERLKATLRDLEERQRPKAVEDMRTAAEMGDRSDNAAYSEARWRLTGIDSRIFSLNERIKYAIPIEEGVSPGGRARIGSTVVVSVNGQEKTYQILGPQETSPGRGRISHLSPLGELLMNRKAGESVTLRVNGKDTEYRIVGVK